MTSIRTKLLFNKKLSQSSTCPTNPDKSEGVGTYPTPSTKIIFVFDAACRIALAGA